MAWLAAKTCRWPAARNHNNTAITPLAFHHRQQSPLLDPSSRYPPSSFSHQVDSSLQSHSPAAPLIRLTEACPRSQILSRHQLWLPRSSFLSSPRQTPIHCFTKSSALIATGLDYHTCVPSQPSAAPSSPHLLVSDPLTKPPRHPLRTALLSISVNTHSALQLSFGLLQLTDFVFQICSPALSTPVVHLGALKASSEYLSLRNLNTIARPWLSPVFFAQSQHWNLRRSVFPFNELVTERALKYSIIALR